MKTIKGVAVVLCDSFQEKNRIFVLAKEYGEFKYWNIQGAKIEPEETNFSASVSKRDIHEDFDTIIRDRELIKAIEYDYPDFYLSMDCFWC